MANVTCITKISTTKGLGGLASSIKYCCNGRPHNSNHNKIKHRAFVIRGWNCSDDPKIAYQDMKAILNNNYINHMNLTCVRDIESFKGLNYQSKKDRNTALELDKQFIKRKFPKNQVLIVGHIDGKNHHIHFHNLVCARRFDNGKSIAHDASWRKTAPIMDSILRENGYKPLNHGKLQHSNINRSRGTFYHYQHNKSYIIWLSSKIFQAKHNAKTLNEYRKYLQMNGVQAEMFKMTKNKTGRKIKLYAKPIKDGGHYKELDNGNYIRFRKHFSYSFSWYGKKIVIRERKLGSIYSKPAIIKKLKQNQAKKKSVQYIPHSHIKTQTHKTPNYHRHHKSLTSKAKRWNYKAKLTDKELSKIMKKANQSDSNDDLFSDLDLSDWNNHDFHSPSF